MRYSQFLLGISDGELFCRFFRLFVQGAAEPRQIEIKKKRPAVGMCPHTLPTAERNETTPSRSGRISETDEVPEEVREAIEHQSNHADHNHAEGDRGATSPSSITMPE